MVIRPAPANENATELGLSGRILIALAPVTTVALIAWVLWYCRYGFDFSDESFYLTWISRPFNYDASVTQFGYIYHPLFLILDGNIALLRQANLLLTFFFSWLFFSVLIQRIYPRPFGSKWLAGIVAALFACSALVRVYTWLPTPNYNSLTLQAILLAATGMLLAGRDPGYKSLVGSLLVGIGGWLAFMAKPPTALALGALVLIYLIWSRMLDKRFLSLAILVAAACLVLSAWSIDGSIREFIDRLRAGIASSSLLDTGYYASYMFRLDKFELNPILALLLLAGTSLVTAVVFCSGSGEKRLREAAAIISVLSGLAGLVIIAGWLPLAFDLGKFQGLLLLAIPVGVVAASMLANGIMRTLKLYRPHLALATCLLALPHVYAFGSGNNYWAQGANAGMFWVAAALALLSTVSVRRRACATLLSIGLVTQIITAYLIYQYNEYPYRQPQALRFNEFEARLGAENSRLILPDNYGHYLMDAISLARKAGFQTGTPMIDLTGHSPGLLFALGADSIGQAWMIGGYPGSEKLAISTLGKVSCDLLSRAWILTEPGGPRELSTSVIASYGGKLTEDYEVVGSFDRPVGAGGYSETREQQILKPVRSRHVAEVACPEAKARQL